MSVTRDEILDVMHRLDKALDETVEDNGIGVSQLLKVGPQAAAMLSKLAAEKIANGPPVEEQIAVRDQLIDELVETLSRIVHSQEQGRELEEVLEEARHKLQNLQDARPS